jgi:hypothetical protein
VLKCLRPGSARGRAPVRQGQAVAPASATLLLCLCVRDDDRYRSLALQPVLHVYARSTAQLPSKLYFP